MSRTAFACAVAVTLTYGAAQWLTHGFQVWTAEGARRLEVALEPVPAPAIAMDGPGFPAQTLRQMLAGEGGATLVDFIYTRCATVCLALGSSFQQMQKVIKEEHRALSSPPLRLLSISFDPSHDDPAALAKYAASLGADPGVWRFARVARAHDAQALLKRYRVTVIPDGLGGYEHNAALLVMDASGRLVRVFDYAEMDLALAYARDLAGRPARMVDHP